MDSISLGTPPPPRRVRPPFYRLSGLSVQYKNRGSYPLFHLYLKGTKMNSTQVHSCLEMFDPSSEGDSIEILIDKNIVILSAGSITHNSFESHCRHKYSNFCLGCRWHFSSFAGIQPGLKCLRLYWCEKSTASSSDPTPGNRPNRLSIESPSPCT